MFHFSIERLRSYYRKLAKNLNAPYRLILSNEENGASALDFILTKRSVYILFSSVFVALFIFYSVVIFYTPLKYYVPGNQQSISRTEMIRIQKACDSLIQLNKTRELFVSNLLMVSSGKVATPDTTLLSDIEIQKALQHIETSIDKASNYEYLKVEQQKRLDSLKLAEANKDNLLIKDSDIHE